MNFDGEELLASEPLVLVHPRMQKGGDPSWQDIYVAEVQSVSTSGFTVNVARLDKLDNSGWGQQVRLDYIAWLPGTGDARIAVRRLTHYVLIAQDQPAIVDNVRVWKR